MNACTNPEELAAAAEQRARYGAIDEAERLLEAVREGIRKRLNLYGLMQIIGTADVPVFIANGVHNGVKVTLTSDEARRQVQRAIVTNEDELQVLQVKLATAFGNVCRKLDTPA